MKIKKATHWTEQIELTRPYTISYKTITAVENIFVKLEMENGSYGIGVASPSESVTGESFDDTRKALNAHLEAFLVGKDIRQFQALTRTCQSTFFKTPAAAAAVDIALYDAFGKYLNQPIVKFLGQYHTTLPTSITIGIKSIAESIEEAKEYLERGFKIIKLKIGKTIEEDVACIRKIHEIIKGQMLIRVDANQGYTIQDLQAFVEQTKNIGVELIEQPFLVKNNHQLDSLSPEIKKILAADESLVSTQDALQLAHAQRFGIFNIKLMKCGGITPARTISTIGALSNIDLMWGCNDESCVSITAGLHAAFAAPNTNYIDLDGSLDLGKDLFQSGFTIENGMMRLTEKAGLGVEEV